MKKIIFPLLLCLFFVGCTKNDDRVFDETAAVRANQAVNETYSTLKASPEGWKMVYYPNASLYGGYQFFFKFKEGNRVDMACDLGVEIQTSSYRVDLSQGPMLIFDSYNYLHLLAEPSTSPIPSGLNGDYEFLLKEVTADKITMTGRKRGVTVQLERASSQDWAELEKAFTAQNSCALQQYESWQLFIKGEKKTGELSLDVLRHNFNITVGTNSSRGTYSLTSAGMTFDKPVTVNLGDGNNLTFDGFKIQQGATFADRTIMSNDPAGTLLFSIKLTLPGEPITPDNIVNYEPDPETNTVNAFLNLKNAGAASRYKITLMSTRLEAWRSNLMTLYPVLLEFRIEAPRSTYLLSITMFCEDSGAKYYYWNCTNGLTPLSGPGLNPYNDAAFAYSGASVTSGWTAPFTAHADFVSLRTVIQAATGFTVLQDENVFWFRSNADPNDWFKCEPY
ncbi:MAG: DUF4302 domain-containing protein [Prevotellaceae bacterium]|jgi:hypothetical protein|nr:DUF4302 domain-containing protein [Prevotellaceae bacterium]